MSRTNVHPENSQSNEVTDIDTDQEVETILRELKAGGLLDGKGLQGSENKQKQIDVADKPKRGRGRPPKPDGEATVSAGVSLPGELWDMIDASRGNSESRSAWLAGAARLRLKSKAS